MGWYEDVYSSPERHGLELFGSIYDPDPEGYYDYGFHIFAVWRDVATGEFYWDTDSGCSCPSPWEDVNDKSRLEGPGDKYAAIGAIPEWDPAARVELAQRLLATAP